MDFSDWLSVLLVVALILTYRWGMDWKTKALSLDESWLDEIEDAERTRETLDEYRDFVSNIR